MTPFELNVKMLIKHDHTNELYRRKALVLPLSPSPITLTPLYQPNLEHQTMAKRYEEGNECCDNTTIYMKIIFQLVICNELN